MMLLDPMSRVHFRLHAQFVVLIHQPPCKWRFTVAWDVIKIHLALRWIAVYIQTH